MASQNALFEAPASHAASAQPYSTPNPEDEMGHPYSTGEAGHPYSTGEAGHPYSTGEAGHPYSTGEVGHPYSNTEFEDEWEAGHEAGHPFSTTELEDETEWESGGAHYGQPYSVNELESEWETGAHEAGHPYSTMELEDETEWEAGGAHYGQPFSTEFEDEGEYFFKKIFRTIGKVAGPIAKRLAPFAAKALVGMIPGVGAIAAPLAGKLVASLVKEGEAEAFALEAEAFGAGEGEVGPSHLAQETALTEVLAAQSAEAQTEAEAESTLSAALPITITIMGGRRALRRVTPVLTQANRKLVRTIRKHGGPAARNLLRTVPSIQRRTIATLRAAARRGRPISAPLAVRAMAAATRRVLGNPITVQRAIARNIALRQRIAPPHPTATRRFGHQASARCLHCLGRARIRV